MPFEHLAAYNLTIPRIDYSPRPIVGNPLAVAALASIGPQIAAIAEAASPEARQRRELANLQLNLEKQKLGYISSLDSEGKAAIFGGKAYDPLLPERRKNLIAQTRAANALADQRDKGKPDPNATFIDDPDYGPLYNEAFGQSAPTNVSSGITGIPSVYLPPIQ